MNTKIMLVLVMIMSFALAGCALFEGGEIVMTTPDNVVPGAETVPVDLATLPESWVDKLPKDEDGVTIPLVFVAKVDLLDITSPHVPVLDTPSGVAESFSNGTAEALWSGVMSVGKTFLPGLAALEGLGLLFFKRKRMHYANAAKAVVPNDGKVDVGAALASFGKALGMAHSTEGSKAMAETGLEGTRSPPVGS